MRTPATLLHRTAVAAAGPVETSSSTVNMPVAMAVDSNMVIILASLLCALVCVLGLALVSRCACRRHRSASSSEPPPKGLKKKVIDALPTVSFASSPESSPPAAWSSSSECAICLAEFADGESVRVLPLCGHGFHVACVDAWLRTRATCPSCRAAIVTVEHTKPAAPMVVVVAAGGGAPRCGPEVRRGGSAIGGWWGCHAHVLALV